MPPRIDYDAHPADKLATECYCPEPSAADIGCKESSSIDRF